MIDINLIPLDSRKRKKSSLLSGGMAIPLEVIIGLGGGLLFLLVVTHVLLLFTNMSKMATHKELQKEWEQIRPSKENVDGIVQEMRALQAKYNSIQKVLESNKVQWSQKLNIISDSLPRGVWLKKISLTEDILFVDGSAISRKNQQMANVHEFTANLNKRKEFFDHLTDLELGSIQRRKINKIEIADFLITTKLK